MSDEIKQDATDELSGAAAAVAEPAEEKKFEPITVETDDLTEEGRAHAEKQMGRKVPDLAYTLASRQTKPGSVAAMDFEFARETFLAEQALLLKDMSKEVTLPGFRKGKAPIKLLQLRMGEDANREAIRYLATNALRQENIKAAFKFVSKPQVTAYTAAEGAPVAFSVEVECEPQIELKEYKGVTVEVEAREVTDAQVDERIQALRKQHAVIETAPEGAELKAGDQVTVDVEVTGADGERLAHLCQQERVCYNLEYDLPKPVVEALMGKKAGETAIVAIENKSTNRKGEEVVHTDNYTVTLREIKASRLPELDDEFAKDLGNYETLADLREKTRQSLAEAEEERQRGETLDKLYRELTERNPVDPPKSLMARQQYDLIMQDNYQLQRMGLRLEHVVHDPGEYMQTQRAAAEQMVKTGYLLDAIAKAESLDVTDADVDAEIASVAEKSGRKPLAVRARLEANKQLDQFRESLQRRKIGDFLIAANTVKKVAPQPVAAEPEAKA